MKSKITVTGRVRAHYTDMSYCATSLDEHDCGMLADYVLYIKNKVHEAVAQYAVNYGNKLSEKELLEFFPKSPVRVQFGGRLNLEDQYRLRNIEETYAPLPAPHVWYKEFPKVIPFYFRFVEIKVDKTKKKINRCAKIKLDPEAQTTGDEIVDIESYAFRLRELYDYYLRAQQPVTPEQTQQEPELPSRWRITYQL